MIPFLPEVASEHGSHVDFILELEHLLMALVLLGWFIYFFYVLVRFRQKRQPVANHEGARSHRAHYVEVFVFGSELVLLAFFSIPFIVRQSAAVPALADTAVQVRVVAQQFQWNVHYPGADGIFGNVEAALINDMSNPLGLDPEDPNGDDDIVKRGQLVLPVDKPAIVQLSSKDVIHSFGLPEFRVKQDAIPGMVIPVTFTPSMTTAEYREMKGEPERHFEIMCAQLCGMGHYTMRGVIEVLEADEYDAWLAENAPSEEEEYDAFFDL